MKNKLNENDHSRRGFIKTVSGISLGTFVGLTAGPPLTRAHNLNRLAEPNSLIDGVQIGVITYSFRSMPDQTIKGLLDDIVNSGINAVELMGEPAEIFAGKPKSSLDRRSFFSLRRKQANGELNDQEKGDLKKLEIESKAYNDEVEKWRTNVSMDKFIEIRRLFNDAGVSIYAWKPNAFSESNTDAEIHYAFRVASVLGAGACTTEFPRGKNPDIQTERLGKIASQHGIYMAYHAHTQATPSLWDKALQQSEWNAINLDLGHWVAGGNPDPIPFIKENHKRIESIHLKDRTTPQDGAKNLPWGQGDTPIKQVLELMKEQKYSFPASIELEYEIPSGSNAVEEVVRCLNYCRNALV